MQGKITLYLCVGSACHQLGVHRLLPRVQSLIKQHHLEDKVELKGVFCLDRCTDGITFKLGTSVFVNFQVENLAQKFEYELLPEIKRRLVNGQGGHYA